VFSAPRDMGDKRLEKRTGRRCGESLVVVVDRKETESPSHGSNDLYLLYNMTSLCSNQLPPLLSVLWHSPPCCTMPDIRCVDSDTTHVSDSEPERETARSRAHKPRTSRTSTAPSRRRQVYRRVPLSDLSNAREDPQPTEVELYFGVEARLIRLESGIAQIQATINEHFHYF